MIKEFDMSFLAAAAIGSAAASGIGSRRARKKADQSASNALGALAGQQGKIDDFSRIADKFAQLGQDSYNRYTEMFGPLEEKLNDYYMNLNPDELAAQGNQNAQQQYQQAMNQVNDQLAAQGISNSGISAQAGMQMGNQMAQTKAQNIMSAPHQVAQQQQGWMNYGANRQDNAFGQMAQGIGMQGNVTNMYGNLAGQISNVHTGQANQQNGMYQQGMNSMGQGLGAAAYFLKKGK